MPAPKRRRRRYQAKDVGLAFLFLLPSALVVRHLLLPAVLQADRLGPLRAAPGGGGYRDVGFDQYREILFGEGFKEGFTHSLTFVLYTVPAGLVLGVLLAVAAHRRLKGIKVFQAIFSSTLASSVAVSSVMFFYLLNPTIGVFQVEWRNQRGWSLFAAALPSIWQNLGLAFVIVLAGLQAVPDEVLEAARLDGFGAIRRLFRVTLPLISPVLMFLAVVLLVFGFQAFAQIDIVTNGGPAGSSETLVYKIYRENQNYGAGARRCRSGCSCSRSS